jgi:Mn2+/Fe2+ NRAMP family transporter
VARTVFISGDDRSTDKCARDSAWVAGEVLARVIRRHYPRCVLWSAYALLLIANEAADLGGMARVTPDDDRHHEHRSREFYAVIAVGLVLGLALDYAGFNAVSMLFWSAVLDGALAPPLIVVVLLLTSYPEVM